MMLVSSPALSSCCIWPSQGCPGRWDSWKYCRNVAWLKNHRPSHCLLTKNNDLQPAQSRRSMRTVALAAAPVRWNLDDVERISRGLPSKAKMGSRAVPHRLNAEERKAFELAKKRGYVVQQANSRRYPLINTYRNYCDALSLLCIRIEQSTTGFSDQVVLDFTPLHLPEVELSTLRAEISKAVVSVLALDDDQIPTFGEVSKVDEEGVAAKDVDDAFPPSTPEESDVSESSIENGNETLFSDGLGRGSGPLKFQVSSRNMTKVISRTASDVWRRFSTIKARN